MIEKKNWTQSIQWWLKQLFPLTYWTIYSKDNKYFITIWKMWFGRSYNIFECEIIQ